MNSTHVHGGAVGLNYVFFRESLSWLVEFMPEFFNMDKYWFRIIGFGINYVSLRNLNRSCDFLV